MHIKLQCECGQRFAFEVEPIHNRMPAPVECPACGLDNTATANAAIVQIAESPCVAVPVENDSEPSAIPAHEHSAVKLATAASAEAHRSGRPRPGQTGRAQAKAEARAKISWGDPPIKVLAYLRTQGYGKEESSALVNELVRERVATIRAKGIANLLGGILLCCISVGIYLAFRSGGIVSPRTLGMMGLMSIYGIWLIAKALLMLLAPKSTPGDVED